jgi:hypothetical protein
MLTRIGSTFSVSWLVIGFRAANSLSRACSGVVLCLLFVPRPLFWVMAWYISLPLILCITFSCLCCMYSVIGIVFVSTSIAARAVVRHAPVRTLSASFCVASRIVVIFRRLTLLPCSGFGRNQTELA